MKTEIEKQLDKIKKDTIKLEKLIAADKKPEPKAKKKKEDKFKSGDWVYWNGMNKAYGVIDGCKGEFSNSYVLKYTIAGEGVYDSCHESNLSKATPKQVEKALIAEAEKRGFKEGVKVFRDFKEFGQCNTEFVACSSKFFLEPSTVHFQMNNHEIFSRGKWATIIENKLELNGKEVEIKNNDIIIGCRKITKDKLKALLSDLELYSIDSIHHPELGTIKVSDLKKLIKN